MNITDDYEGFDKAFSIFKKRLSDRNIQISEDEEICIATATLELYQKYQVANHVTASLNDPLKLFSWFPFFLINKKYFSQKTREKDSEGNFILSGKETEEMSDILNTAISTLSHQLKEEGYKLDNLWLDKLYTLAFNGLRYEHEPITIGKIGLYASFKSASNTKLTTYEKLKEFLKAITMTKAVVALLVAIASIFLAQFNCAT